MDRLERFSARWQGELVAPESGEYEIGVEGDDGFRLWLDDKLVVEDWADAAARWRSTRITLRAGQAVRVRIDYYQGGGERALRLAWRTPSEQRAMVMRKLDPKQATLLPAGTDSPDFQLEGADGLLVTGSIDVPEGFASSGRGSASIDGSDVDADVAEGEVSSPDAAPVRASKAVSSYANARVQIAPQKQRSNVWPVAIGVGAGGFAVAVTGFIVWALSQGIL